MIFSDFMKSTTSAKFGRLLRKKIKQNVYIKPGNLHGLILNIKIKQTALNKMC